MFPVFLKVLKLKVPLSVSNISKRSMRVRTMLTVSTLAQLRALIRKPDTDGYFLSMMPIK